jgi:hypothetical protein
MSRHSPLTGTLSLANEQHATSQKSVILLGVLVSLAMESRQKCSRKHLTYQKNYSISHTKRSKHNEGLDSLILICLSDPPLVEWPVLVPAHSSPVSVPLPMLANLVIRRMKAPHPDGWVPHRGYSGIGTEQGGAKTASETDNEELKASLTKKIDYKVHGACLGIYQPLTSCLGELRNW